MPDSDGQIALDPPSTDAGSMERLFLLEAVTPAQPPYDPVQNPEAMRLMRQTIENGSDRRASIMPAERRLVPTLSRWATSSLGLAATLF